MGIFAFLEDGIMNKRILFLAVLLLSLLLCLPALADEARDITDQCRISVAPQSYKVDRITDRDYATPNLTEKQRNPTITVTSAEPMFGVYVCFGTALNPWQIEARHGGVWETVYESQGLYAHEYAPLPGGETEIRFKPVVTKNVIFNITELFAFSDGEIPDWVQIWHPAPEKADLLVLAGHPDDEILFFGGCIPTYAGERQMNVVVAYLTCGTNSKGTEMRRSELLNGLWAMGVRTYPVFGGFWDGYSKTLAKAYDNWGKSAVNKWIVSLLRQYKPEVVVTHDTKGEYGHGAHQVCADAMLNCIKTAADESKYTDSTKAFGTWELKKLYLHLYKDGALEMDWDQPLSAFGGRTGFEVAEEAYQLHVSQKDAAQKNPDTGKYELFVVEPRDSKYSCYRFGLAYSAVGPDVEKNDFFEHIPVD